VLAALAVVPAAAQAPAAGAQTTPSTQNTTTETRPSLPTLNGDTGFWAVPTAEVLPSGRWSFSLFGDNYDTKQGLTDARDFGVTAAIGLGDRAEIFGSFGIIRISRNVRVPTFVPGDPVFGGVAQEFPFVRRSWSKNLGGPIQVGAKYALISQSRGDAMSLAPRLVVSFPTSPEWASHDDYKLNLDLVASREFGRVFEASAMAGAILRGDADEPPGVSVSDGIGWGLGATFPSRSPFRALVEWKGEYVIDKFAEVRGAPMVAEDGSEAPTLSVLNDPSYFKAGVVWQAPKGFFVHGGLNYSQGAGTHTVGGINYEHKPWGFEASIGWHPGVKVYVPPPPPAPVIREVVREVPAQAPATPPNRGPNVTVNCDPGTLEAGQTSRCTATATDPDGDALTLTWVPQGGSLNANTGQNVVYTAGQTLGNYPLCVTAADNRGGTANACFTMQVIARRTLMFEDVHFDFDKYNLRPDALQVLDAATMQLVANPNVRITIEGHCDSIGTVEYNLALGERRANVVRDYLAQRGIMNTRLRTVSYGEERPKADNNTAEGRAQNRRAALVVIIEQQ
jgi:peptidoglycan-associated lipoprotein